MTAQHPKTLPEWKSYAATLAGEELRDKVIAANSVTFVRTLQAEGYTAEEIHTILVYLARRFPETGQHPPGDGLYDLTRLAKTEPPL
ncbi:hypothetical protein L6R52_22825 [Myxococcota bacterium]|nr:hypothetical protein [Myxococcota bacterium]